MPGKSGKVEFLGRALEHLADRGLGPQGSGKLSIVIPSKNGRYLASCTSGANEKTLAVVWDLDGKGSVAEQLVGKEVQSMHWSFGTNALLFVLEDGSVTVWNAPVPEDLPGPNDMNGLQNEMELLQKMIADDDDEMAAVAAAEANATTTTTNEFGVDDEDLLRAVNEAESNLVVSSSSSSKRGAEAAPVTKAVAETPAPKKSRLIKSNSGDAADEAMPIVLPEEDDAFDTPFAAASYHHHQGGGGGGGGISTEDLLRSLEEMASRFNLRVPQPSFGPSASAVAETSNRRVLVWNRVGRVISVDGRSESIVEVEFADTSMHRKIRVAGLYMYTCGALSEAGAALAAAAIPEQGARALVHFKPVTGLVGGAEWQELLEQGDDVAGVAMGNDWIAAVTLPWNYLRIWSVCGLQQLPLQLPISKFVSMVGQGTRLAVFHHNSAGLQVLVYDLQLTRLIFNCAAPITPKSELTWCGFTPTGVLVTVDSAGVGRVLINAGSWTGQWVPLTNPEGSVDVSRRWPLGWPIGATDDSLIVVRLTEQEEEATGLVLDEDNRGAPVIDTVRWTAPLVNPNAAMTTGLEVVLRRRLMLEQSAEPNPRRENEIDSEVVKLIVLAAKNGHAQRGIDLFRTIKSSKFKMVAMKWCGANGFDALFTRMEQDLRAQARAEGIQLNENEGGGGGGDERPSTGLRKRGSHEDDLFDREEQDTGEKKRLLSSTRNNNKSTSMKRSSSGVMEALASIEVAANGKRK